MHPSIERGGHGAGMPPTSQPEASENEAAPENESEAEAEHAPWVKEELARIEGTAGERPSIAFLEALKFAIGHEKSKVDDARKKAAKERNDARSSRKKNRGGAASGSDARAEALDEEADFLESRMRALEKARDEEENAVNALLGGADGAEDAKEDIRRAA